MEQWLIVHVMKTAGTSFRLMLDAALGDALYPTRAELRAEPKGHYPAAADLLARIEGGRVGLGDRRVLCGHYPAALAGRLPGRWRSAVFLRDPVARTLSMIAHRHKTQRRFFDFRRPSISAFLEHDELIENQIRDYQTKVFALGAEGNVNRPLRVDGAAFREAKRRLLAMDFVGLTEDLGAGLRAFSRLSGIALPEAPIHANRSPSYSACEEEIERVRRLVPYDIELYELARERARATAEAA